MEYASLRRGDSGICVVRGAGSAPLRYGDTFSRGFVDLNWALKGWRPGGSYTRDWGKHTHWEGYTLLRCHEGLEYENGYSLIEPLLGFRELRRYRDDDSSTNISSEIERVEGKRR